MSKKELRKWFIFKNIKTGLVENWYGTSSEADVHMAWNSDLYCIEVRDIK